MHKSTSKSELSLKMPNFHTPIQSFSSRENGALYIINRIVLQQAASFKKKPNLKITEANEVSVTFGL